MPRAARETPEVISRFFIDRPVFANVIAIVTIVFGLVTLRKLPVEQYPVITPPTVTVTTTYPGANAQVVADTVATPIEIQVNGVENMLYISSSSASDGSYRLTVTFDVGTNLDIAQVLVQNRVAIAQPLLPDDVKRQGITTKKQSTNIIMFVALSSPDGRYDSLYLANYATLHIRDELSRIYGVGDVTVFGAAAYSMRVWMDPPRLKSRGLTTEDVVAAIQEQNVQVELGSQTYDQYFLKDRKPAAGIGIYQLPGANALEVADHVREAMNRMQKSFPEGMEYAVPLDTTLFVRQAIREVYWTLFEASGLVLVVILVFLQDWRAVLVPATTVPVTIIGAFAGMAIFGFTINLLTLFGLVLAIGIVVDDVIVENASHHIETAHLPAREATIRAMEQVTGPVMAITAVLMAVFLPAVFLGGITGQLYRQFALTIAVTAAISAVNALTLKPAQCAVWLRPTSGYHNAFFRGFNALYARTERAYVGVVAQMVRRPRAMLVLFGVLISLTLWWFFSLPTGFLPTEDQGYFIAGIQLPDAASLPRTTAIVEKMNSILLETPGVANVNTIGGFSILDGTSSSNSATFFTTLTPWDERKRPELQQPAILAHLRKEFAKIQEGMAFVFPPPAIRGLGVTGGFQIEIEDRSSVGLVALQQVV